MRNPAGTVETSANMTNWTKTARMTTLRYTTYYSRRAPDSVRTRHRLLNGTQHLLTAMLCETERFFLKPVEPPDTLLPLKWDAGAPWSFKVSVTQDDAGYSIKGVLARDG